RVSSPSSRRWPLESPSISLTTASITFFAYSSPSCNTRCKPSVEVDVAVSSARFCSSFSFSPLFICPIMLLTITSTSSSADFLISN
ncbi:hypothetical protein PMAYCL1PPCAC_27106, partial [Pristionchus mayeri]